MKQTIKPQQKSNLDDMSIDAVSEKVFFGTAIHMLGFHPRPRRNDE